MSNSPQGSVARFCLSCPQGRLLVVLGMALAFMALAFVFGGQLVLDEEGCLSGSDEQDCMSGSDWGEAGVVGASRSGT